MTTTLDTTPGAPLTVLSEEEQMFQQSVHDFAVEKIRPLVHQMDHDAKMSPELIQAFFELGIMGIETPIRWAPVAESVDAPDLKSVAAKAACRFESGPGQAAHPH